MHLVEDEPVTPPMSAAAILAHVQTVDDKHDDGHQRLRLDLRELEQRVQAVERMLHAHALQLATPVDVNAIKFSMRTVISVVGICVSLALWQWGLNTRLETNLMAAVSANAKLQEERYLAQKEAIEDLRRRVELSRIELTAFKENVLQERRRR